MNSVYLKSKKNIMDFSCLYFISVLPLIIYGLYKNVFLVFRDGDFSFLEIINPILILALPVIIILLYNMLHNNFCKFCYDDLPWLFVFFFLPPNSNVLISTSIFLVFYLVSKKIDYKINLTTLFKLVVVLVFVFFELYSYQNLLEMNFELNYNTYDMVFGKLVAGTFSSHLILTILTFLMLCTSNYYKKSIPLIAGSIYTLLVFIFSFFINDIFVNISGVLLFFVLLGSFSIYTPVDDKKVVIYSSLLGILTFVNIFIFNHYEAPFVALLILQIIKLSTGKVSKKSII